MPGAEMLKVIAAAALVLWFSVPTLAAVVASWRQYDYSHGYLIPLMVVVLIAVELRRAPVAMAPSWRGFTVVCTLLSAMVIAHASTTLAAAQLIMPLLWIAVVWAGVGLRDARRFVLPLGLFYFATPVWHVATDSLQALTVAVVSIWVRAAGLPAFVDGNFIHLPSGTFEVEGGCAGLRFAIVAPALAMFAGVLHHRGWSRPVLLAGCALALALFGNWVRVLILVVVGHLSDMQHYLLTVEHSMLGWTVFVVFMMPVLFLDRFLQARDQPPSGVCPAVDASRGSRAAYAVLCGVLGAGIWLNYRVAAADAPAATGMLGTVNVPGWTRAGAWQDASLPMFVGATMQRAEWYLDGDARVGAFLAHYASQRQGSEIVSGLNRPAGSFASMRTQSDVLVVTGSGRPVPFREIQVSDPDATLRLVWVGWRVGGTPVASALGAKGLQALRAVHGRRDAQALVLTAGCSGDCAEARAWLSRYAAAAVEPLYEQADAARAEAPPAGR